MMKFELKICPKCGLYHRFIKITNKPINKIPLNDYNMEPDHITHCTFCGTPNISCFFIGEWTERSFHPIVYDCAGIPFTLEQGEWWRSIRNEICQRYVFTSEQYDVNVYLAREKQEDMIEERIIENQIKKSKKHMSYYAWNHITPPQSRIIPDKKIRFCKKCGNIDLREEYWIDNQTCEYCGAEFTHLDQTLNDYLDPKIYNHKDRQHINMYNIRILEIKEMLFNSLVNDNPELSKIALDCRLKLQQNEKNPQPSYILTLEKDYYVPDKTPEPQPQEVYHAPTPEPDTRPRYMTMKKVTIAYCKRCGYIRIDVKKASRCMYCDNDFTLLSLPIKDYKKRMSTSEGLQEIKQEIFDQYIKDNPEYDIRIVNIKEHNGDKIQYCTTCGNIELNDGIVVPARRDRYVNCEFCGSPYITTDKYFTDILDKESYTSEDFYMVQKYIFETYNIKNNPNYSQKKRDERIIAFNKRNKEIGLKHDWEYKEYTEPYSEADLSDSYGTIQYCPTCGYIDLSHKTNKLCSHCSSLISDTGEWLKDYIAKGEFVNADDIEYKVRIKEIEQQIFNKYIKDNPQLNETLMNDRLLNEIHGDKTPEPQPQEVYHAPTPEPDTRPRCPICGSTNIHKISAANKIGSAAMFGVLAAGHVSKTFKCDHCGAKF